VLQFIITVLPLQTGNLTCGSSDANYRTFSINDGGSNKCTSLAWYVRNYPERVMDARRAIQQICGDDGRTAAYRIEFEALSCNRSNGYYNWMTYHSCCYSIYICLISLLSSCLMNIDRLASFVAKKTCTVVVFLGGSMCRSIPCLWRGSLFPPFRSIARYYTKIYVSITLENEYVWS
jgi:hypothetical protein